MKKFLTFGRKSRAYVEKELAKQTKLEENRTPETSQEKVVRKEKNPSLPQLTHAQAQESRSSENTLTALVLYDYNAEQEDEITISRGDLLLVFDQDPSGWWTGECGDQYGLFPGGFVKILTEEEIKSLDQKTGGSRLASPTAKTTDAAKTEAAKTGTDAVKTGTAAAESEQKGDAPTSSATTKVTPLELLGKDLTGEGAPSLRLTLPATLPSDINSARQLHSMDISSLEEQVAKWKRLYELEVEAHRATTKHKSTEVARLREELTLMREQQPPSQAPAEGTNEEAQRLQAELAEKTEQFAKEKERFAVELAEKERLAGENDRLRAELAEKEKFVEESQQLQAELDKLQKAQQSEVEGLRSELEKLRKRARTTSSKRLTASKESIITTATDRAVPPIPPSSKQQAGGSAAATPKQRATTPKRSTTPKRATSPLTRTLDDPDILDNHDVSGSPKSSGLSPRRHHGKSSSKSREHGSSSSSADLHASIKRLEMEVAELRASGVVGKPIPLTPSQVPKHTVESAHLKTELISLKTALGKECERREVLSEIILTVVQTCCPEKMIEVRTKLDLAAEQSNYLTEERKKLKHVGS